jgi:LysR family glycine cleavage system transcriptional activator
MRKLPPLNALRAFEAAATLESFQLAAEELHVTPSAVSHQIRVLEDYLGTPLFHRQPRAVRLTRLGRSYLPPISDALDQIHRATHALARRPADGPLTLSVAPTFAVTWLAPRLGAFQLAHPEIEVRLISSVELVDFVGSDVDLGIRSGNGQWLGLRADRLMQSHLVPVCSPALAEGPPPLHSPADLALVPLIQEITRLGLWRTWFSALGVEGIDTERGPWVQSNEVAIEAATGGLGVALTSREMAVRHLAEGRLVIPFEVEFAPEQAYYLVYPESSADDPRISAFRDWILGVVSVTD